MRIDTRIRMMKRRIAEEITEFMIQWEDELVCYGDVADAMDMIKELSEKILAYYEF